MNFYMWWFALTRGMVVLVASVKFEGSCQSIPQYIEITLRNKARM